MQEDFAGDDAYQKAYAKWGRLAERAVMPNYCHARTWRGVQCIHQRGKEKELCKQHQTCLEKTRALPFGRFDQPISEDKLHARLHRAAVCEKTATFRYYSRDRMWDHAKRFDGVDSVEDLDEDAIM